MGACTPIPLAPSPYGARYSRSTGPRFCLKKKSKGCSASEARQPEGKPDVGKQAPTSGHVGNAKRCPNRHSRWHVHARACLSKDLNRRRADCGQREALSIDGAKGFRSGIENKQSP